MAIIEEFDGWLKKGLGRAVTHLRAHDGKPYLESVLNACIHNLAYDSQCECSREEYLKDLIQASGDEAFFRQGLMRALTSERIDTDQVDLGQIIAISRMFAERDDAETKVAMYGAIKRAGFESAGICYTDMIALDGTYALRVASEDFPKQMGDFDLWMLDEMLSALEARDGAEAARLAIHESLDNTPKLNAVAERIGKANTPKSFMDETDGLDYALLKLKIQHQTRRQQFSRWGQSASAEELQSAADDLINETDSNRLLSYLSIFRKVQFPGPIDRLLELAEDAEVLLSRAAIRILSRISDPRIRILLLKMMDIENRRGDAVELMTGILCEGDFLRIEESLRVTQDIHSLHSIGMGLRYLLKTHCVPESIGCLMFLYENDPCSLCRGEFVENLITLKSIPEWMRDECLLDSDPETRKLVQS